MSQDVDLDELNRWRAAAEMLSARNVELERALRENEARRHLIDDGAQAVWETDPAGVAVVDSPSWRSYTGQSLDQLLGYGWLNAIHPDDRTFAERQWREAVARHERVNAEFRLCRPDGGWRWTNVRAAPVFDDDDRIVKWVGMNIDIDARRRAEAALSESEEKYRGLFEQIDEGFSILELLYDDAGNAFDAVHLDANPAHARHSGIEGIVGKRVFEVLPLAEAQYRVALYDEVARTGQVSRIESEITGIGRWVAVYVSRLGDVGSRKVAVVFNDITDRKHAEQALRASEERQAFLLTLSDALRPLADARAIRENACRALGDMFDADRVYYVEVEHDRDVGVVVGDYQAPGLPSLAGCYPYAAFKTTFDRLGSGETWIVHDVGTDLTISEEERRFFEAQGVVAWIDVPLVKSGRLEAVLCVVRNGPHQWSAQEITVVNEVADRLWAAIARARAEARLQESEARFVQFANAASSGLWIRDADTLAMEYVSPAMGAVYGIEPGGLLGDVKQWASIVVPDDREAALEHLQAARDGVIRQHEFRIQRPSDGAFRWIRNTAFPLDDDGHVTRIGGIAEDITEAKLAIEHQGVLLAELQHRVRNIMAIIRSIVSRTAGGAVSVEDYSAGLSGRLLALARVQALLTRAANVGVGIGSIVRDEVSVQAQHEGQYVLEGPDIALSPKAAEVLTLAVHELATNALKYGALSVSHGKVTVRWHTIEKRGSPWLVFDWSEEGAPKQPAPTADTPQRVGFGSELIRGRVPYELRGKGSIAIGPGGAECHLEFPLKEGASVLETGAPQQTIVYGGALDMTGEADLSGHTILVVEDDFYIATDTARALTGAGAAVLGPCSSADQAIEEVEDEMPTGAVIDINLGSGPSFTLAHQLTDRSIPFVFVTGYDEEVIPAEFDAVPRLQKPLTLSRIVNTLAGVVAGTP